MEPPDIVEERRATVVGATSSVKIYVIATVTTAAMTIAAVVVLAILAPENTAVIASVIGISTPIIMSLLGLGQRAMAVALDGKMSHLLRVTAEKERAVGKLEGLTENSKTNS